MKIYITGPSGSGKTTLSRILSDSYKIKCYELDCLIFDDEHDHVRRSSDMVDKLFADIIKNDSWIIEDVGREVFEKGKEWADVIYYLNISKVDVLKRVNRRWFMQRIGKESYNYPPTLFQLFDMNKTAFRYFRLERQKLLALEKYKSKVVMLSKRDLTKMKKLLKKH